MLKWTGPNFELSVNYKKNLSDFFGLKLIMRLIEVKIGARQYGNCSLNQSTNQIDLFELKCHRLFWAGNILYDCNIEFGILKWPKNISQFFYSQVTLKILRFLNQSALVKFTCGALYFLNQPIKNQIWTWES